MNLEDKVKKTVEKYRMFSKDKPVPIGFSGGKDSTTNVIVLKEMGYDVRPIIVDRGDDPRFNSKKIASILYEKTGIEADILKLREADFHKTISPDASEVIKKYLHKIDNIGKDETLCTPCYNARTVAMKEFAKSIGSPSFAIGQHKTDMVTSLMKCYWTEKYYYAFTKTKGIPYDGFRMKDFIERNEIDLDYLEKMVEQGRATTDDPPVEIIGDIKLVRPLEAVSEREIKSFIGNYPHESNNCSYREKEPRPFRLLVQFDLEKRTEEKPELEDVLYELVLRGLKEDGTLKYRPRNKRDLLYPGFKTFIRKVGEI
jgi:tRNA(Ile)-lysidine synthase TilS/MesJ